MEAGIQHHVPHFHAYYQNEVAVYGINPIELISGNLPKRPQRLVGLDTRLNLSYL